jgi:hypothetical protein
MNEQGNQSYGMKMRYYFMLFMSLIYVGAGIGLLTAWRIESLSDTNQKIIGAVLLAYGIFRIYTLVKRRGQ